MTVFKTRLDMIVLYEYPLQRFRYNDSVIQC